MLSFDLLGLRRLASDQVGRRDVTLAVRCVMDLLAGYVRLRMVVNVMVVLGAAMLLLGRRDGAGLARDARNQRQTDRRRLGQRRVATLEQEGSVIDYARTTRSC